MTRTAYLIALALAACSSSGDDSAVTDGGAPPQQGSGSQRSCDDIFDCDDTTEDCVRVPKSHRDYVYDEPGVCGPPQPEPEGVDDPCRGEGIDENGCPAGYTCLYLDPADPFGICTDIECDGHEDCESSDGDLRGPLRCEARTGLCEPGCDTDANCESGFTCHTGFRMCVR